jgi:large repetitive protein
MKRLFQLLLICFTLFTANVFAQETVCNNYLDDDGDGFIDCFDSDCSSNSVCDDFYLGNDAACQLPDPPSNKFTMTMDWSSPNETTNHLSRMAIGDLNRDGVPEIVTMNRYTKRVFILNGSDGSIQSQATVAWEPYWEIAIANIDDDACGEIFFIGYEDPPGNNNNGVYMYAYDCNLNFLWRTAQRFPDDPINYGIADFDSDGRAEIYAKDEIYDAKTGVRIVKTTAASYTRINGGPTAVDMDNDGKLELIIGLAIYKVNLGARTVDAGSLTLVNSRPEYFIRYPFNATSVADYNLDGNLDIIASGSTNSNGANTTVFFWDVAANTLKTFSDPIAGNFTIAGCPASTGTYYQNGWQYGTGRINLADLDGDGKMNASYVSGKFLYALKEDFSLLWRVPVNEETSGHTGCTLFDFNGDGQSEIVYRDEKFIYIINGNDGSINTQQACVSRTNREYPIVADVDADGSTEICVTCGFNDAQAVANFCDIYNSRNSHVRVFKSATEPWVPARRLWNQHGYFNVNVNNDLTIPRVQQKHHVAFSAEPCKVGQNVIPRPLNNFLNQSPYLDSKGCQVNVAPDLGFVDNSLAVNSPTCPDKNFTVSFSIINHGDAPISGDLPITFYSGDPMQAGAIKLNTMTVTLVALSLNQVFSVTNAQVTGLGIPFELYIVLNDDGTSVPTPIDLKPDFIECNYINNIEHIAVSPLPVAITAIKVQDNIVCNPGAPPNGAVRAFIQTGAVQNTIDYNFYWTNGLVAKPIPADFIGPVHSGIPAGDYVVYAVHKTAGCGSDTALVSPTVADIMRTLDVTIKVLKADDNCQNPNGQLRAFVNEATVSGGEPAGNFTYEWYVGPTVGGGQVVGNSHIASNLVGGINPYTVLVTEKATGCSNSFSLPVPDLTAKPVVQASVTDILCSNANSGSATATVGGVTAGFTFEWYRGGFVKPTTDFPGAPLNSGVISSLQAGTYTVVAKNSASKCVSDPVTVTIKQTLPFVVTATKTSDQTSCDMTQLNGAVSATVGGVTTGYTFEWFKGQNTLVANRVATTNTASALNAGVYTVKATETLTGCTDTHEVTINFAVATPVLTLASKSNSSRCFPPDGSIRINVSIDTPSDYTFFWYTGSSVKATPDFPDTDNELTGLAPGIYTVRAINNIRHCEAPPITETITSIAPTINFNQTAITRPTTCNESNGSLTIGVNAAGNIAGFDFEWRKGQAPFQAPAITTNISNTATTSTISQLFTGVYTLIATNRDNGCTASQFFNLPFDNAQVLFFDAKTPIETCVPGTGGSITVNLVKTPGFFEEDYEIQVYEGTNDLDPAVPFATIPCVNGQVLYTLSSPALQPGFYTFVAKTINPIRSTFGCRSAPVTEEILIDTQNPTFTANPPMNNTNCAGTVVANGQITLNIASPANFNFDWFEGTNTSSPPLGTSTTGVEAGVNGEIIQNLPAGFYTVNVTDNTFPSTGCSTTQTFQIFDNPPIITLAAGDILLTDNLRCDMKTGAAVINSLTETVGGVTSIVGTGGYTFEWFDANQAPLIAGPAAIGGLSPGTYFVEAKSLTNNCASAMMMFEIKDMTIGDPTVSLISFVDPTRCLKPLNLLGELHVDAVGNSTATIPFKYRWFAGSDTASFVFEGADFIGIAPGSPDVTFTVKAINNTTKCFDLDTYTLPTETAPILLSASASSLTFCNTPYDGSVFATITSGSQAQYNYDWYYETVKATPDFPPGVAGVPLEPLDAGDYIIIATDQLDPTCFASDTVTITNERMFPKVIATSLRGLSICDLLVAPADGVAEASVEGEDIIQYKFDWYRDNLPPAGNLFANGSQVGGLADSTYFVVASHIVTGCSDSTSVTIPRTPLPIPFPQISILSMQTSCQRDPDVFNGSMEVSVGGNTQDYIFDWFVGSGADTTYLATGEMIDSLPKGFYTVTATSRETGCVSVPVNDEIKEELAYPDFNFKIEPATCDQPDGFLTLFMTTTDLNIASIIWTAPDGSTISGSNVMNAPAGVYKVEVKTDLGCATPKEIELLTEIKPYNGISVNGDSQNPIFQIDCIQNFPDNLVQIFNRAGTLVYEAVGYDNQMTVFDGKSNKGISIMGTQLPGGTYYYIIDKRDGSKALAGYLEIVN